MEINVFSKYNVHYRNKYSYRVDADDFREDMTFWDKVMQGGELMDLIGNLFKERNLIRFTVDYDLTTTFYFEMFDTDTGEGANIEVEYWEYKKEH